MYFETQCPRFYNRHNFSGKYTENNVSGLLFRLPCTSKIRADEHVGVNNEGIRFESIDHQTKFTGVISWRVVLSFRPVSGLGCGRGGIHAQLDGGNV
jgi:hypothetical protein